MRACLLICVLISGAIVNWSQSEEQRPQDWQNPSLADSVRFNLVYNLAWDYVKVNTDTAWFYSEEAWKLATKSDNKRFQSKTKNLQGSIYQVKGDYVQSGLLLKESIALAEASGDLMVMASVQNNYGSLLFQQNNYPEALLHFRLSHDAYLKSHHPTGQATALNNIGMLQEQTGDFDSALKTYEQALELKKTSGGNLGLLIINIGNIYHEKGEDTKAEKHYLQAIDQLKIEGDLWNLGDVYSDLAELRANQGEYVAALEYYDECLRLSEQVGSRGLAAFALHKKGIIYLTLHQYPAAKKSCSESFDISEKMSDLENSQSACECLHRLYKETGDYRNALYFHELASIKADSLMLLESVDEVLKLSIRHEYEMKQLSDSLDREEEKLRTAFEHQAELGHKKNERNWFIALAVFVLITAGVLASRLRFAVKTRKIIQQERERSENLLLNILPFSVAQELKQHGKSNARHFENATVLFTDFCAFTALAEKISATELIQEVDHCFQEFDRIIQHHGLEKIKTIGDSYMAVAGLPDGNKAQAKDAVLAALEMIAFIENRYRELCDLNKPGLRMRAGLHSGPLIAGIVGLHKIQYDIWGDTVNTASRVESASEPGKLNISADTYRLVADNSEFQFIARGFVAAKNKGQLEMYFVQKAKANS
jgi:adenylate cyclase